MLVEAEAFEDLGGWTLDTQFTFEMGSPYLLAHGLGRPVALTFFEEFELAETAKLLRDRATFSAQQLGGLRLRVLASVLGA